MTECRFCLKVETCKRNKNNAKSCRLYEENKKLHDEYREECERAYLKSREKINKNPMLRDFMGYAEAVIRSIK